MACRGNCPLTYRDSVYLFDKLNETFSRYLWYLDSDTEIDPMHPRVPIEILHKAKKAYAKAAQKAKAARDLKGSTFEEAFAANERSLTPPRNTVSHRHTNHPGQNPLDYNGRILRCTGCGKIGHLFKVCHSPTKLSGKGDWKPPSQQR